MNEKIQNRIAICLVLLVLCTIYLIFAIKYNSRQKINELKKIERMIIEEEERIRLLKIDFEHISRPKAVRKMLFLTPNLEPIKPSQVIVLDDKMIKNK